MAGNRGVTEVSTEHSLEEYFIRRRNLFEFLENGNADKLLKNMEPVCFIVSLLDIAKAVFPKKP